MENLDRNKISKLKSRTSICNGFFKARERIAKTLIAYYCENKQLFNAESLRTIFNKDSSLSCKEKEIISIVDFFLTNRVSEDTDFGEAFKQVQICILFQLAIFIERKFDLKTNSDLSKIIKNNGFLQSFYINLGV